MKTIFDRIIIGGMECSNRILRSATWEGLADEKGFMMICLSPLIKS